jgi:hypothetical protein
MQHHSAEQPTDGAWLDVTYCGADSGRQLL